MFPPLYLSFVFVELFVLVFSLSPHVPTSICQFFCLVPEGSQSEPVFEWFCGNAANFSLSCTSIHSFIHLTCSNSLQKVGNIDLKIEFFRFD